MWRVRWESVTHLSTLSVNASQTSAPAPAAPAARPATRNRGGGKAPGACRGSESAATVRDPGRVSAPAALAAVALLVRRFGSS
jgi:hypothetical protein